MGSFNNLAAGCPCGCVACVGQVCVTVRGCGNALVPGAAVTVKLGGTTVGTGTTNGSGVCCVPITSAGTYTITVAGPAGSGYTTVVGSYALTCTTNNVAVGFACSCGQVCVTVVDCSGAGVPGSNVTLTRGGTPIGSCTTDGSGRCCMPIPSAGTYDITATSGGLANYAPSTTISQSLTCTTNNVTLPLDPAAGYSCTGSACCHVAGSSPPYSTAALPATLYVNDGFGLVSVTGGPTLWIGQAVRAATGPTSCPAALPIGAISVCMRFELTCHGTGAWSLLVAVQNGCGTFSNGGNTYPTPMTCTNLTCADDSCADLSCGVACDMTVSIPPTSCQPSLAGSGTVTFAPGATFPLRWVYGSSGATFTMSQ